MYHRQVAMINPFMKNLLVLGLLASLSACATTSHTWQDETHKKLEAELDTARKMSSLSDESLSKDLSQALLPPLKVDLGNQSVPNAEERFNIAIHKSKVKDVYLNLVKGTAYNVMLDPSIEGNVSLKLNNVTIKDVFDYMETAYGFHYEKTDENYIVYGKTLTTKIYQVDYLNIIRGGSSTTEVASSNLKEDNNKSGITIETSNKVEFWNNLTKGLESIVGTTDGRNITINQESGVIIARALPGELKMIGDYLKQIQSSITRQVILEAKLLEVELSDGFQTGINWGKLLSSGNSSLSINQVGGGTAVDSSASNIAGNSTNNIVDATINGGATSAFGGIFSLAMQSTNFGAFIEMISTQGKVNVLSSPRIATVNNQKAVIKVGGEEYYVTGVASASQQTQNNTTTTNSPSIVIKPFFSGIALDVTPQIDAEGNVVLHLHPTVSDVTQKNKSFIVDGKGFDLPLATSSIRETDSIVRAKDGQIIVVGGLMKQASEDSEASVPLLGDIPFIGRLFKHKKTTRVKKELVVLVKPTLTGVNDVKWSNEAASSLIRFSEMR